ncbi:MAG: amidohydrolase [Deltaproteobacteria bacterium]|nr:amidohydrolase [Deltaproteobacteria bacterium]
MRAIDVHAHVVLEETFGTAGAHGPTLSDEDGVPVFRVGAYCLRGVRYRGSPFMDPAKRVAAMDAAHIGVQVLSPNPLTYFHHVAAKDAIAFCRRHNDALAKLLRAWPGRLLGFAALPMQDVSAALDELDRARELGLLAGYIGTDFGTLLDAPALDRFYEGCVARDVPLFLHPAPAGIDGPPGDPRLGRFDLDLVMGFAAEETLSVATLIYGGVLDRHPNLDVCISHGGGAAPYLVGRMAAAARKRAWAPAAIKPDGAFEERLARLWYDVHVHDARALELLRSVVSDARLVYGTNFAGWDQADPQPVGALGETLARNAARLLRKPELASP